MPVSKHLLKNINRDESCKFILQYIQSNNEPIFVDYQGAPLGASLGTVVCDGTFEIEGMLDGKVVFDGS